MITIQVTLQNVPVLNEPHSFTKFLGTCFASSSLFQIWLQLAIGLATVERETGMNAQLA